MVVIRHQCKEVNVDAVVSGGGNDEREEAMVIGSLAKNRTAVVSAMEDVNTQAEHIQSMEPRHGSRPSKSCTEATSR